jgi:hypothetical protein
MNLPEILGTGIIWAAMSVVGFGLFALLLSLLGPLLWVAYEAWIGYIAPVIGGVVGVALESGILVGVLLESRAIGRSIAVVGSSMVIGALASMSFEAIISKKKVSAKALSENLIAGLGFGLINGLILAALSSVLEAWG